MCVDVGILLARVEERDRDTEKIDREKKKNKERDAESVGVWHFIFLKIASI